LSEDDVLRRRPACHKSFPNSIFMGAPTRGERAGYSEMRSAAPAIQGGGQADQNIACRLNRSYYSGSRTSGTSRLAAMQRLSRKPLCRRVDGSLIYEMGFRECSRWGPRSVRPMLKPMPENEPFTAPHSHRAARPQSQFGDYLANSPAWRGDCLTTGGRTTTLALDLRSPDSPRATATLRRITGSDQKPSLFFI